MSKGPSFILAEEKEEVNVEIGDNGRNLTIGARSPVVHAFHLKHHTVDRCMNISGFLNSSK